MKDTANSRLIIALRWDPKLAPTTIGHACHAVVELSDIEVPEGEILDPDHILFTKPVVLRALEELRDVMQGRGLDPAAGKPAILNLTPWTHWNRHALPVFAETARSVGVLASSVLPEWTLLFDPSPIDLPSNGDVIVAVNNVCHLPMLVDTSRGTVLLDAGCSTAVRAVPVEQACRLFRWRLASNWKSENDLKRLVHDEGQLGLASAEVWVVPENSESLRSPLRHVARPESVRENSI